MQKIYCEKFGDENAGTKITGDKIFGTKVPGPKFLTTKCSVILYTYHSIIIASVRTPCMD